MATKQRSFKKGDMVTWTSSANGTTRVKTGKIIEVVKPGCQPQSLGKKAEFSNGVIWHGQFVSPRREKSYVVAELDKNGKVCKSQWKRYYPLTSKLSPAPTFVLPNSTRASSCIMRAGV